MEYIENDSRLVKIIDPILEYKGTFDCCSNKVCLVSSGGVNYILKAGKLDEPLSWSERRKNEINVLQIAKDVKGITHLVEFYPEIKNSFPNPIYLKEYVEGFSPEEKLTNLNLINQLKETSSRLYPLGLVGVEWLLQNLVISKETSQIFIIDLDNVSIFHNFNEEFEFLKKRDKGNLQERICA